MDFLELKKKALELKDSAAKAGKGALDYSSAKLASSKLTLSTIDQLNTFLEKSIPGEGKDSATGKKKIFTHRVIIIFADTKSDFFQKMLVHLPVLAAKAFSQSIPLRLADISMKKLDHKKYNFGKQETLVLIENKKIISTVSGAENIQKLVKSMSLDINKSIEEL